MNLTSDPWIPVVDHSGNARLVSLLEVFRDGSELRDLSVPPPQRIAVMRLLTCIAQAALDGPENVEDWRSCGDRLADVAEDYLRRWKRAFDLFGTTPFLQITSIGRTDNATLDKLDFGLSSGHNDTHFDHGASEDGRYHASHWVALNLLTYQCFSPGGTIGEGLWNHEKTGRSSTDAPCVESSMLLALIRGSDMLATVRFNLIPKSALAGMPFGRPVWERPPDGPRSKSAMESAASYLGRLVPLSRGILLSRSSTKTTLVNGIAYPRLPAAREPMATVELRRKKDEQEYYYLRTQTERHPWRELQSVLALRTAGDIGGPLCLRSLRGITAETADIWVGGLARDKAKILDTAEWSFTVPLALLGETELACYEAGVVCARDAERRLKSAVKTYARSLLASSVDSWRTRAVTAYWAELDSQYHILLDMAAHRRDDETWRNAAWQAAIGAFRGSCPHTTPRQIQAFARGQRELHRRNARKSTRKKNGE